MSHPTTTKLNRWLAKVTVMLAVLASLLSLQALSAPAAEAFTYSSSGRPGGVTFPRQVTGSHLPMPVGGGVSVNRQYLTVSPVDVTRSPATSGTQIVTADYEIYTTNSQGQWVFYSRSRTQATIPTGYQQARQPIWSNYPTNAGYFQVRVMYTWWSGQTQLGQHKVNWSQSGDYKCAVPRLAPCSVGAGYIYLAQF